MQSVERIRVKICCIASVEEARLAIQYGADALGLVSDMPSGPGVIPEERIAEIAAWVPPPVATFLLTCAGDSERVIAQVKRCGTNTVQLCDRFPPEECAVLREALPGIRLVQVIHVTGRGSIEEAREAATHVDAVLLDSGNPALAVKELGGTGRVHDWSISREIREAIGVPMFLAGGLNPDNVEEAIRQVGPFGVDVCSGVRRDGRLDENRLKGFLEAVGRAGAG